MTGIVVWQEGAGLPLNERGRWYGYDTIRGLYVQPDGSWKKRIGDGLRETEAEVRASIEKGTK